MLGKFPTFSWSSDSFTNWLTQNAINIASTTISSAVTGGALLATGQIGAGIGNIAGTIANTIGAGYDALLEGNNAQGNANGGDVSFTFDLLRFKITHLRPKIEYIKIIDDYFSMYGYKTNSLKLPNITGRRNWNFVKTINCNLEGNIPQLDLQKIKEMFNGGVTLWHNPSTFLDYTQTNDIL